MYPSRNQLNSGRFVNINWISLKTWYFNKTGVDVGTSAARHVDTAVVERVDVAVAVQVTILQPFWVGDTEIGRLLTDLL